MDARSDTGRRTRLRVVTAAACSLLVAAGGVLAAAPARADACADTTGDLPGVVVLADDAAVGLLGCSRATSESTAAPAEAPAEPAPTASAPTEAPIEPAPPAPTEPTDAGPVSTTSHSTPVRVTVRRSSGTVYPVKDGYRDAVRFSVRETDAAGDRVPLVGAAVLSHAGRTVETWPLQGTSSVITWDGRDGSRVRAGLYTLSVSVQSPDGTRLVDGTTVRVMPQHLAKRTLRIRTDVGARSTSAELPKQLVAAYRLGRVWISTRTVAVVRGPATLVFSSADGHRKAVRLRNGVHTTEPTVLPPGFERVTITHRWKKGAAHLKSLQAIWTYSVLE